MEKISWLDKVTNKEVLRSPESKTKTSLSRAYVAIGAYESGVNYNVNSNYTKYLACTTLLPIFLRFGKFPPQICESCGVSYRWNYETFRAL